MSHRSAFRQLAFAALATAAALGFNNAETLAQDQTHDPDQAIKHELNEMRQELQRLREENASMRAEVDELHAANDDNWMTE